MITALSVRTRGASGSPEADGRRRCPELTDPGSGSKRRILMDAKEHTENIAAYRGKWR